MAEVTAAKVPKARLSKRELYATVCFYYPQYTLRDAQRLPARDIRLLIRTAKKHEAMKMYNLIQIAAAPHTKKGQGVKKLLAHFKRLAANG
jgi:hypothetical protein